MNPEFSNWPDLQLRAAQLVPSDLSRRVIVLAGQARARRYELRVMAATLALCLISTGATVSWWSYRQNAQTLTQWQELAVAAQTVERGL